MCTVATLATYFFLLSAIWAIRKLASRYSRITADLFGQYMLKALFLFRARHVHVRVTVHAFAIYNFCHHLTLLYSCTFATSTPRAWDSVWLPGLCSKHAANPSGLSCNRCNWSWMAELLSKLTSSRVKRLWKRFWSFQITKFPEMTKWGTIFACTHTVRGDKSKNILELTTARKNSEKLVFLPIVAYFYADSVQIHTHACGSTTEHEEKAERGSSWLWREQYGKACLTMSTDERLFTAKLLITTGVPPT